MLKLQTLQISKYANERLELRKRNGAGEYADERLEEEKKEKQPR